MSMSDTVDLEASLAEPERFAAIFDRYHGDVWSYLARLGGREAADDLAGEVFVQALACRAAYRPEQGGVRPWLYGIATNVWRGRVRSDVRGAAAQRRMEGQAAPATDLEDLAGDLDAATSYARVVSALAKLHDIDRAVLVLYAWEELSYTEIAAVLGVPVGTVRSRLARARERLRELLDLSDGPPRAGDDDQGRTP